MTFGNELPQTQSRRQRIGFAEDFRRFFTRGLAALLPTLITLSVLIWAWDFLWDSLGRHLIFVVKKSWQFMIEQGWLPEKPAAYIGNYWSEEIFPFRTKVVGVLLAMVLVYMIGLLVGNLIGRTAWKLLEVGVMKIPIIRAIYPAVKQVTDFVLQENKPQFRASRVVAVQPHEKEIWSIGLVTGPGLASLSESVGEEMVSVFVPSSPTAFSGYVLVVPRRNVVELPMTVEEVMRMLVSGGVIVPDSAKRLATAPTPADPLPSARPISEPHGSV